MELMEDKRRIAEYFVTIDEDKFTKVKYVKSKHNIEWKGKDLENKLMSTQRSYSHLLKMGIDYRKKDDIDCVLFRFTYSNTEDGFPGMENIKMYLILDDDRTIELSDASGFDNSRQSAKAGSKLINVYVESAQLTVSTSDFIAVANAKKIEYSIRFGQGRLENAFSEDDLLIIKGFYNAAFDDEFDLDFLISYLKNGDKNIEFTYGSFFSSVYDVYISDGETAAVRKYLELSDDELGNSEEDFEKYVQAEAQAVEFVNQLASKAKEANSSKYTDPIEKYFLCDDRFNDLVFNGVNTISLIESDKGNFWPENKKNQIIFSDIKVGIKCNPQEKSPRILIFPSALVYCGSRSINPVQINYSEITSVETKKGFLTDDVIVLAKDITYSIDFVSTQREFKDVLCSFLRSQANKQYELMNYITEEIVQVPSDTENDGSYQQDKNSLIKEYRISESDLKRLVEIEKEKAKLGLFSMRKEKLKAESMRILKPYSVKFMDLGLILEEVRLMK